MYYKKMVKIPEVTGKIMKVKQGKVTYIRYEYDRTYNRTKKITYPKRVTIGKMDVNNDKMMYPNETYIKYFPELDKPFNNKDSERSSCLRVGNYIVLKKIIKDYNLNKILKNYFNEKELGLFLDLAIYSIVTESNVAQYYPDYAYNHPLFSQDMKIYSDATISSFLKEITEEQSVGFLNEWNENRNCKEKIYISYDSTNKNCQAGDLELLEYGNAKKDIGEKIFNYSIGLDLKNREPLFYERYSGSIVDVSQLILLVDKAKGYGYKNIGFVLDRGYFSKKNIEYMDECKYSFVMMVKGMDSFISNLIKENKGAFEGKRVCSIDQYGLYGKTIKSKIYESDNKERYIHLYHSMAKDSVERTQIEVKINAMKEFLERNVGREISFGKKYDEYFILHYDEITKEFAYPKERIMYTEEKFDLCGYFAIITSEEMTAKEALDLYKSRDASEKLFGSDKTFLGNESMRVQTNEAMKSKIFIEFVALILRNKIYTSLKDVMTKKNRKLNSMTVPAAIKELEKIEMVRQTDNVYRLDHAVTATQKAILDAFGLTENNIKYEVKKISNALEIINDYS